MPADSHSCNDRSSHQGGDAAAVAKGWSLLLPDNWCHVPLDESRHHRVAALMRQVFASLPRDGVYPWRRDLEQQITSLMDEALANGGSDVYLMVDPRFGLPLAATCLASLVPVQLPVAVPAEILARTLATQDRDQPSVLPVHGQDCPAIRRQESAPAKSPAAAASASGQAVPVATVSGLDVFIPFPGGTGAERTLLLSFRTPITAVADPMVTLFEAITQSLHWTWA